jgi:hypothetical protein
MAPFFMEQRRTAKQIKYNHFHEYDDNNEDLFEVREFTPTPPLTSESKNPQLHHRTTTVARLKSAFNWVSGKKATVRGESPENNASRSATFPRIAREEWEAHQNMMRDEMFGLGEFRREPTTTKENQNTDPEPFISPIWTSVESVKEVTGESPSPDECSCEAKWKDGLQSHCCHTPHKKVYLRTPPKCDCGSPTCDKSCVHILTSHGVRAKLGTHIVDLIAKQLTFRLGPPEPLQPRNPAEDPTDVLAIRDPGVLSIYAMWAAIFTFQKLVVVIRSKLDEFQPSQNGILSFAFEVAPL